MDDSRVKQNPEYLIIEDEEGYQSEYNVDAVIEMHNQSYVLYSAEDELNMKRIEHNDDGTEILRDVSEKEMTELMDAYQQAIEEEAN